jgi:hypothetical protein
MFIKEMFEIGEIMEDEDKAKSIQILNGDDCQITGKVLNKNKIILHVKRLSDGSEGNVFIKLKDKFEKDFVVFKKVLGSKKLIKLTLNEFREFDVEKL